MKYETINNFLIFFLPKSHENKSKYLFFLHSEWRSKANGTRCVALLLDPDFFYFFRICLHVIAGLTDKNCTRWVTRHKTIHTVAMGKLNCMLINILFSSVLYREKAFLLCCVCVCYASKASQFSVNLF